MLIASSLGCLVLTLQHDVSAKFVTRSPTHQLKGSHVTSHNVEEGFCDITTPLEANHGQVCNPYKCAIEM